MKGPDKTVDSWLVLSYQSGHKKSMAILVKRWHYKFCKQAYYYTRDFDAAKDIAQESWQIIINKICKLDDSNKFGSWALSIVNRRSIDWLRKKKRTFNNLKEYYESGSANSEKLNTDLNDVQRLKEAILPYQ